MGTASHTRRVLVVDDDHDVADSMKMMLEMMGYVAEAAYDGQGAIAIARTFRPDVVLLDIGLPRMNGYCVARQMREESEVPGQMIVAITGHVQKEYEQRAYDAGFDAFLAKPAGVKQLEALLNALSPVC